MAFARAWALDQTNRQLAVIGAYGGSDNTGASFNVPKYVRFGSINTPKDFGLLRDAVLDIGGMVGAQSGTQTLFFSFTVRDFCRLGLRKTPINRYTDQYVAIGLSSKDLGQIPLQEDFSIDVEAARIDLGYVTCGYWDTGYAQLDCQFAVLDEGSVSDDEVDYLGNAVYPPGDYCFTVSSSQWPQLPYRVQLAVASQPVLAGIATQESNPVASIAIKSLTGIASMESAPFGVVGTNKNLQGIASNESRPRGTIQRRSPFG